ncbi:MAG: SpoIIE family protein phosphatase [Anaerolineae bacterium]|nr:SpoIIE family protein phosphatase [Anaerolineae bacterium]MCB0243009.1 SpoIIE family protein phosphatase [Anaerolineae bacterium]MCB0248279.1 SpoIIE family protein phosphatase [Anaerolineae bacterium]MCB9129737.1 SpoIIE family protein phosphatase [Anaerolineales bacterium]
MSAINMRDVALFAALSDGALDEITAAMPISRWPAGSVIYQEGEPGDSLCIVREGTIEVIKALNTAEEWLVRRMGPGNFVGELVLLEPGSIRSATVRALTDVEIASLGRAEFDALLAHQPHVAAELMETLSRRLREANDSTIRDLRQKNSELETAYRALQEAQAQIIEKERLERELQLAHDLQQSMLPRELPVAAGYDFGAMMTPAQAVGGDFYDFMDLGAGRIGIVVADVSDKGMSAALFMALTRSLIRAEASRGVSPPEALRRVNYHLLDMNESGMFVTVLYGILDTTSGDFLYARAGHELPLVYDRSGATVAVPVSRGQPLALLPDPALDEQCIAIPPGGRLVLNSDGVTDAINRQEQPFGVERLHNLVPNLRDSDAQKLCHAVFNAVKVYEDSTPQFDDFTLVIVNSTG